MAGSAVARRPSAVEVDEPCESFGREDTNDNRLSIYRFYKMFSFLISSRFTLTCRPEAKALAES